MSSGENLFGFSHDSTGKHLVATQIVPSGTVIFDAPGVIKSLPDKYTIQYNENSHIRCDGPLVIL